jgi:hypothetical protein
MPYHCRDCSYRGATSGQGGACPACGSFNLRLTRSRPAARDAGRYSRLRLVLLVSSWSVLALVVLGKLQS